MSTLSIPPIVPSPREDAIQLYKAFRGFGCDSGAIMHILGHRDAKHRSLIRQEYRTMYHQDLLERLSKELKGKLETAVLLWMHDPASRDAIVVKKGLSSGTSNLKAVAEVICSRSPSQLQTIKQLYHFMFKAHLEHDIKKKASGDHGKLLLAYVSVLRPEGMEVDKERAANDAKALYKAGEKKLGTDETTFIKILSERSRAQLVAITAAYHNMYGSSLKKVLHGAMAGLGTDDATLIRVIVTRTEMDMRYVKAEYSKKYKQVLNDAVESETSGDYKTFLLHLLGPKC